MTSNYDDDLQEAAAALDDLYNEQSDLEVRIAKQQRRVAALRALVEDPQGEIAPDPNLGGLTESIKSVLQAAFPMPLTVSQIKERLLALHFAIHEYRNFRGSLHTVLKRITDSNLAERMQVPAVSPAHASGMRGEEPPPTEIAYQWTGIIRTRDAQFQAAKDAFMGPDLLPGGLCSEEKTTGIPLPPNYIRTKKT